MGFLAGIYYPQGLSYDSVYNRTSWYDSKYNYLFNFQDNALNQYTQISYNGFPVNPTYDDRGNCTYFGSAGTFSYDQENHLVSAGSVSYTYDLLGRRLSRTYSGNTTTYVWDGAHIVAEYTNGSLTKTSPSALNILFNPRHRSETNTYAHAPYRDRQAPSRTCFGSAPIWGTDLRIS